MDVINLAVVTIKKEYKILYNSKQIILLQWT